MGLYEWRLNTSLNYLAGNLAAMGRLDDVEVVFTDWGSETPLHRVLQLGPSARRITRFVVVPPAVALELQRDSVYPAALAIQAGVFRSQGKFTGNTDGDMLFTREFLEGFLSILDGTTNLGFDPAAALITAARRNVPESFVKDMPSLAEIDYAIHHAAGAMQWDDTKGGFGGTGMILLSRDLWDKCGGYDERMIHVYWMDIDLCARVTREQPWLDLTRLCPPLFHMAHTYPSGRRVKPKENPRLRNTPFRANSGGWGLAEHDFEIVEGADLPPVVEKDPWIPSEAQGPSRGRRLWIHVGVAMARPAQAWRFRMWFVGEAKRRFRRVLREFPGNPVLRFPAFVRALWRDYVDNLAPAPPPESLAPLQRYLGAQRARSQAALRKSA